MAPPAGITERAEVPPGEGSVPASRAAARRHRRARAGDRGDGRGHHQDRHHAHGHDGGRRGGPLPTRVPAPGPRRRRRRGDAGAVPRGLLLHPRPLRAGVGQPGRIGCRRSGRGRCRRAVGARAVGHLRGHGRVPGRPPASAGRVLLGLDAHARGATVRAGPRRGRCIVQRPGSIGRRRRRGVRARTRRRRVTVPGFVPRPVVAGRQRRSPGRAAPGRSGHGRGPRLADRPLEGRGSPSPTRPRGCSRIAPIPTLGACCRGLEPRRRASSSGSGR